MRDDEESIRQRIAEVRERMAVVVNEDTYEWPTLFGELNRLCNRLDELVIERVGTNPLRKRANEEERAA